MSAIVSCRLPVSSWGDAPLYGDKQIYGRGHASSAVYLPGIKKYVGAAVLDGRFPRTYHKDEGRLEQLLDGSQPLRSKGVHDTELVVTFYGEKQGQLLRKAQAKTGQSNQSQNISESKGGLDIGARFNVKKASEIEWALREGGDYRQDCLDGLCVPRYPAPTGPGDGRLLLPVSVRRRGCPARAGLLR